MISRPASLRARMTLLFTAGFGAFVILSIAAILLWSLVSASNTSARLCEDAAALIRREWESGEKQSDTGRARVAMDEINEDPRFASVAALIMRNGHVLASSHVPGSLSASRPPHIDGWQWTTETTEDGVEIFSAGDTRPAFHALQEQAVLLLLLGLLAVGAASRAAWVLVGRTLQPIDAVSRQAALVAATDSDAVSAQLTPPSNDAEVRHLVETLNALLSRLHDNTRRREQWYAAAAHELRTPLAVLSGSLEVALNRPRTQTEYEETLQSLQNQTRRLISLTEGVLLLSRLDAVQTDAGEAAAPVSLVDACDQSLDALGPLIEARALHLTTDFAADVPSVIAPPSHVAMLTRNLLENAVKYAPNGGQITVSLHDDISDGDSRGPRLEVFNTHDTARDPINFVRVFEPFYREKHVKSAGSGLGLAICRRLADVNGWQLEMEAAPDGVCVTVCFSGLPRS